MKYFICLMLLLSLLTVVSQGCTSLGEKTPGDTAPSDSFEAEGAAMGYRGMIHVLVSVEQGTITDITVIESFEDRAVGGAAIEELTDLMLMYNTTEVDAISGATETSRGFIEAVENAIMRE